MKNPEVARILYNIAIYMEMQGEMVFKVRAYEKAAQSVEALGEDVNEIYGKGGMKALEEIPGVGKSIAEKIEELLKTGKLKYYEALKKKIPVDVEGLRRIEGIGPKTILALYKKLKIKNIEDLEKAAKSGKIRTLEGFGQKSEENILKGIEFMKRSSGRYVLGHILPLGKEIEKRLASLEYVKTAIVAGSFRRRKETIGDIDILVVSGEPKKVMDYFVKMPEVINVYGKGETKSTVKLENGIDVDVRVVEEKSYGAALNYFTGSKDHNISLRRIAVEKGLKLSEYGLFKKQKFVGGRTEEEVYKILGLRYIEPEIRENTGEIEASKKGALPKLIGYSDLKGDLQTQTSWTDGSDTIEEMALAAKKTGLEYIAITDHTKALAMTGGLDESKIAKQGKEIDKVNEKLEGIKILKGAEVNIMKDGHLDISDKALSQLDIVGAAVHSNFNLSREDQTKRIISAISNEHVDILFHPTGRIIQKREPYDADIQKIIDAAKDTGTVLEIDAYPDRLDLKDEHVKLAVSSGAKLCIDSDAHNKNHFRFLEFGIAQARRGWAEKKDVINALPLGKMLKMIKGE
ncbi:MAG: DNA polymerase/3'-5' exonuclease PolX [Candidatus Aenigmarchaeota archaeon]|nr:DNA polymerase/3'-5' exonuclease PolX [Candidatus Aenigmarchaeota archaeon]